ncbi:hypothetical protein EJF18_10507 [Clavispora lusitaniae]|uniref:Uncharacterized protein n=2 Tax=Clavispora lusitaniae TaxID=36911 RepID=C4XX29_CLAL4|nr:uncharacterized protein CLUG_00502 [Clavispora lusitaniae ATCC 42720]QFZ25412.1 hypothetical protein EJF14_10507 [Clavispora lusitaniae]EEQ36379.1 predicted protein [Clavispora lusitaniae ATCC 42720]QFZ31285.1 hypothetical protein EJF16_10507 [Clavispora lusitaniae]QFZ36953.1 hypothetical protein EJF15_10507 [Clavispora lusitaniae]QFZ42637.1 hypothetical protein EJF18_10507 [Clavispora lusitaniae]
MGSHKRLLQSCQPPTEPPKLKTKISLFALCWSHPTASFLHNRITKSPRQWYSKAAAELGEILSPQKISSQKRPLGKKTYEVINLQENRNKQSPGGAVRRCQHYIRPTTTEKMKERINQNQFGEETRPVPNVPMSQRPSLPIVLSHFPRLCSNSK